MPTSAIPRKNGAYLPTLDGWRAIAIFLVLLAHDRVHTIYGVSTSYLKAHGGRGVDIFFAISGLLICTRLLEEEKITGRINIRHFLVRRVFRIQPAALTYLLVITILMVTGALNPAYRAVAYALVFVRDYLPLRFNGNDWYTMHFWSLSVEEHFYFFLPVFLLFVRKYRVGSLVVLAILVNLWEGLVHVHHIRLGQFGWSPQLRTDFAINGILIAVIVAVLLPVPAFLKFLNRWLNPWAMIAAVAFMWWCRDARGSGAATVITPILYPFLLLSTILNPGSLLGRFLESVPMRTVGRYTYSIYLWQSLFLRYAFDVPGPNAVWLQYIQGNAFRYLAIAACSILSYHFIEKPFVRWGHRLAKSPVPGRGEVDTVPEASVMGELQAPAQ